MNVKTFFPILIHLIICVCWYALNDLFFIGPEPGRLTQYVYNFINQGLATILMIAVAIIGLCITFSVYFIVGKQIQVASETSKIMSILSITLFNLLILLVLLISTKNINSTIYISQLTFNAPFFVLAVQCRLDGLWSTIAISIFPSIIMFAGYLYRGMVI